MDEQKNLTGQKFGDILVSFKVAEKTASYKQPVSNYVVCYVLTAARQKIQKYTGHYRTESQFYPPTHTFYKQLYQSVKSLLIVLPINRDQKSVPSAGHLRIQIDPIPSSRSVEKDGKLPENLNDSVYPLVN